MWNQEISIMYGNLGKSGLGLSGDEVQRIAGELPGIIYDFENGRLTGKTTDFFYKEIAEPYVNGLKNDIEFTFFDIREYEKPLRNDNPKDDNKLTSLFKLLSIE